MTTDTRDYSLATMTELFIYYDRSLDHEVSTTNHISTATQLSLKQPSLLSLDAPGQAVREEDTATSGDNNTLVIFIVFFPH